MLAEQVRAGLAWRRSDAKRVPLNAAGSALLDQRVIDKQKEWLDLEQQKGGYEAVEHYKPLHSVYSNIAQFINCSESEVALVESATVAWQRVFYGFELSPEHVVLMSSVEYGSNAIALLQQQRRQGFQIRLIPEYSSGEVNIEALNDLLSHVHSVALVSLTHIPTSSGIVQPAALLALCAASILCPILWTEHRLLGNSQSTCTRSMLIFSVRRDGNICALREALAFCMHVQTQWVHMRTSAQSQQLWIILVLSGSLMKRMQNIARRVDLRRLRAMLQPTWA
jgi:hypothetical protein